MKMSNVVNSNAIAPSLQGLGQYTYSEMLAGLAWQAATPEDIAVTLGGLGSLASQTSVMDAIIGNAVEMRKKKAVVAQGREELARSNPQAALQLMTSLRKTAQPGTSVVRAVEQELKSAAQTALVAKADEKQARALLAQNDKRAAAAKAVDALQNARNAIVKANRAEKTRLTSALDSVAKTLEAQAKYVDEVVAQQAARSGQSPRTDALRASAENLRAQAKKLRAESAVVAQAPVVPADAPSEKRIADVANRFNIRTARWTKEERQRALISVLSDIADDPMAQVQDYEGAMTYYGNDPVGRLMADIEFGNVRGAVAGLSKAVHGMGYMDTTPVLAKADRVLASGVKAAQQGYVDAVIPAFVGHNKALPKVQMQINGLAGLNALAGHPCLFLENPDVCRQRTTKWDKHCTDTYGGNEEMLNKCLSPGIGCDILEPYSAMGKLCRGITDIGGAIAQVGGDVVSGKAFKDLPKAPAPGSQPAAQQPPPATMPPKDIVTSMSGNMQTSSWQAPGNSASSWPSMSNAFAQPASLFSNPLVVGGGVAVIGLLGFGVYRTMLRR